MKRRDFLALLSTAGAGAALLGPGHRPGAKLRLHQLEAGSIDFSHRRQGFGHPVTVTLQLPNAHDYTGHPQPLVVREGAEGWIELIGQAIHDSPVDGHTWTWTWHPPPVVPTDAEMQTELIRYRLVLLDEDEAVGLVSQALEVVCARRGWGA